MSITLRVDSREVDKVLKKGQRLLNDSARFMQKIGQSEVNAARTRIRSTKESPSGRKWAPWAPATAEARRKQGTASGGLLHNTGTLYSQFNSRATRNKVIITNRAPYATYLQNGTRNMPAREFLGWSRESITESRRIFRNHMRRW